MTALGLLNKYANNLLKQESERPQQWREIYLANETFSLSVDNVKVRLFVCYRRLETYRVASALESDVEGFTEMSVSRWVC